jgi:hypothetical protein
LKSAAALCVDTARYLPTSLRSVALPRTRGEAACVARSRRAIASTSFAAATCVATLEC